MPRGKKENLRTPSTDEARKIGKKGGKASGKVRKGNRMLQDAVKAVLAGKYQYGDKMLDGYSLTALKLFQSFQQDGRAAEFNALRDIVGEKPADSLQLGADESVSALKIKFVNKSKPKKSKEKDPPIVGDYSQPVGVDKK